ncbi:MAG TPA: oxalate/formate MFS antiporter [Rhizomicrobium sp.]|nr:oxalate/formate MFS antiporter [Rhizomicrobium sp.]
MSSKVSPADSEHKGRYLQLIIGILCMVMIANLQYGWNLFVDPMSKSQGWSRAAIGGAFSIFVLAETWLVPVEGWFVDKFGPRIVVTLGGILVALAWSLNSMAHSIPMLYVGAVLGGIGAGAVYGTCVGNALKWFVGRRGMAAGFTAAGFGAGAAATVLPILYVIDHYGYRSAFLWFGLAQGLVIVIASQFLRAPPPELKPMAAVHNPQSKRSYAPGEVLQTPLFWLLYVMFVTVASGGLIVTAQFASIAADYGVAKTPLNVFGIAGTVLTVGLVIDNVLNGLGRPLFGWISDKIGREETMFVAFMLNALSIWSLAQYGHDPIMFVICSAAIYLTWGEIYSLFPATCTDAFGSNFATTNAGMLYTAKGTASLVVPFTAYIAAKGDWGTVFWVGAIANVVVAVMAIVALKPMRAAQARRRATTAPAYAP